MSLHKDKQFAQKHGPDAKPDILIKDEILKKAKNNEVPCAVAFEIAKELQVSADAVGMNVDMLDFKLTKCQLGLFGYYPQKKMVKPQDLENQDLNDFLTDTLVDGRLSCKSAWDIASSCKVNKMKVSGACEAMGIKIKNCQLGAF